MIDIEGAGPRSVMEIPRNLVHPQRFGLVVLITKCDAAIALTDIPGDLAVLGLRDGFRWVIPPDSACAWTIGEICLNFRQNKF